MAGQVPAGQGPSALVARDFNGDGHLDLAVANRQSDDVSILLGDGANNFSSPTNYTVGMDPFSISAGDFNGDGKADLVTTNYTSHNISVLLGTGAGTFGSASNFATDSNPHGLGVGDFNGDNLSDIAVGSGGGSNTIAILLSNGAGGFSTVSPLASGGRVNTITLGKFNADNILDLALGMENQSAVFMGDGSGGFTAANPLPNGFTAKATGDLNGDGRDDLVGANGYTNGISVLLGNGAGNFSAPTTFPGIASGDIVVGDFNGDGKNDVAVADGVGVSILLGDGAGNLGAPTGYAVSGSSDGLVSADFNADGKPDLAVGSQLGSVTMLYGAAGGDFSGALNFTVGYKPDEIAIADFNHDGKFDVAVANNDTGLTGQGSPRGISVLLGDGTGRMTPAPPVQIFTGVYALVTADFNNDNKADLAAVSTGSHIESVHLFLGNGDGSFGPPINTRLSSYGRNPYYLNTADFNRDGAADLVVTFLNSGNFVTLLGTGTGNFTIAPDHMSTGGNSFEDFTIGDFNQDAITDLAFVHYHDKRLIILLGNGNGYFSTRLALALHGNPLAVVAKDFNRDGKADLAITATTNFADYYVSVRLGEGEGNFGGPTDYLIGQYPQSISDGDFNGDGFIDLVTSNSQSEDVSVLTGDGAGGFGQAVPFVVGGYPSSSAAADFNADGKTDLAVSRFNANSVAILLNDFTARRPCLSVNDVAVTEGDAGANNATFNVTLSEASAQPVRVNFRVEPRALLISQSMTVVISTAGVDYQPVSGTLTFAPGTTTQTINVPVNGDITDEYDEAFSVILSSPGNAVINDRLGIGTILDNDAPPTMTIDDATVVEGNGGFPPNTAVFNVTLSAASAKSISLFYQTADGTTSGMSDYQPASVETTFNPGTTKQTISITITGDRTYEPDETFFVNISSSSNATVADAQGQGTITNDDPLPTIPAPGVAYANEGDAGTTEANVIVQLSNPSYQAITVNYSTVDSTAHAGDDYVAASGSLTFNPGEVSKTVRVTINGDVIDELDETFNITLGGATNATTSTTPSVVTILDNDGPNITINDISVVEGDSGLKNAMFTVSLSAVSPQSVTFTYATTTAGTATAGIDYLRTSNNYVQIPAGQLSATFNLRIIGDLRIETDETVNVALSNVSGGTLTDGLGVCTILNDDAAGALQFSAQSYNVGENSIATVNVIRVDGRSGIVSATFSTVDGTATAGSDYTAVSQTITFADGDAAGKTITIPLTDDSIVEAAETINVTLAAPTNGAILGSPATAVLTITDNDEAVPEVPTLQFGAATYAVSEGDGRATVTVTRTGGGASTASVDYRTVDTDAFTLSCADTTNNGGAFARCDFATTVGTLSFAAGELSKTITVPVIDDGHDEGAETFQLQLSNAAGAGTTLGSPSITTITIQDNDATGAANPIITASPSDNPFFVRQQYLDFLSREPEPGEPWTAVMNRCVNVNTGPEVNTDCDRIAVSGAFFGSPEFRLKGFYVFRFYKLAFDRLPQYGEIVSDMSFVAGATEAEVYARKAQLATAFVARPEFLNAYGSKTNAEYVEALLARYKLASVTTPDPAAPDGVTKLTLSGADLTNGLNAGTLTRAQVLRAVADSDQVGGAEYNSAFVAVQYYGYLRRTPEESGYQAWLRVITQDPNNVRIMIHGFMNSTEYRLRFGQP
ncbi:MAG TPA: Calx-beta domain-containing protein [Pyrinomonadaceae bacterium]